MEISILFGEILGGLFLVVGLSFLINKKVYLDLVDEMIEKPGILYLSAMLSLIFGLVIVYFHNIWACDWRVFVTISGWLALAKGVLRFLIPFPILQRYLKCYAKERIIFLMED